VILLRHDRTAKREAMNAKPKPRTRVGRPAKSDKRDLRAACLDAAVKLFSEHGFTKVSIREITDLAGGSVGLIRHYFGSKGDLIAATNDHVISTLQEAFDAIGDNLEAPSGAILIDRIQERTVNILGPKVSLLFYLRRLISEDPASANGIFRAYFQMLQANFNKLEAAGALAPDANKVWLTFQLMFVQLGPVFLAEQIEAILGESPYEPGLIRARGREAKRLFRAALKPEY
jgi:AcrR family transcriptional regulator